MFTYKKRNTFLQGRHPLAAIFVLLFYVIGFVFIKNPVYMSMILLSLMVLALFDGCLRALMDYGKMVLPVVILICILNPLLVHNGSTVLYKGNFNFPVLGPLRITLEAIIYGLVQGIRILCVTMAFGFGNLIIHPDRSFGYFSKYIKKSALLMSMTIGLFPRLMKSYSNITDIEKLRGNLMFDKNLKKRVRNQGNIVNILFLSSLEDSSDMAESMYSRGYGIGKRSSYFYEKASFWDISLIMIVIILFVYIKIFTSMGFNKIGFYPRVQNPISNANIYGWILCSTYFIIPLINWGWNKWK